MKTIYLWVDKILHHPGGTGVVSETTDLNKINYNRSLLRGDLQKTISIQLLPIEERPTMEAIVFLGKFLCYLTLAKNETYGKMLLLDIRIKSEREWICF